MSEDLEKAKELEISFKATKQYDYEYFKEHITEIPCNIWGYIQHLEQRIQYLELELEKLKGG